MPVLNLPSPKAYVPVTFLERGVLVPFTTPMLAGTRARPAERFGTELLVPNLSGGRGVYVLPWDGIHKLCCPTVHDRRLNQKVEALITVTPSTIRQAARLVAIEGLAGREAQVAAATAADLDHRRRLRTNFLLLVALLARLEPGSIAAGDVAEPSAELEARACSTVFDRAPRLGLAPETVTTDLEQLAEVFSSIGVHGESEPARIPALLEGLSRLHEETTTWAREHRGELADIAAMIAEVAGATVTCAASTLRDARLLTEDAVALVRQWNTNPGAVIRLAARPEWLLDGWEQICLLWREAAMPGAREAALTEMAMLAPVLPKEIRHWVRTPVQQHGLFTYRRTGSGQRRLAYRLRWPGAGLAQRTAARPVHVMQDPSQKVRPMTTPSANPAGQTWLPQRQLSDLHKSLANAQDAQITRLVAMVDALRDRGVIDDLVAPFRERLAQLRPARPLRFIRLLFNPLDPLIVPAPRWRPGAPSVPRTALPPLAEAAHATMGEEATRIDALIAGTTTRDVAVIAQAGALLWPSAAQALLRSAVPPDWTQQTGLPQSLFGKVAGDVAAVLDQVLALQTLRAEAEVGVPLRRDVLTTMLRQVNAARPQALGHLIALVLARLPEAGPLLRQAGAEIGGNAANAVRAATEQAKSSLLERLEAEGGTEALVVGTDLAEAGAEVRQIATLLQGMETGGMAASHRVEQLRRRVDLSCRTRFTTGLRNEFLRSLESLGRQSDDAAVMRLEEAARGLRQLGAQARHFGSAEVYEALLRQTTDAVKAIVPGDALSMADKVRLVEILAGPDEAWALLDERV